MKGFDKFLNKFIHYAILFLFISSISLGFGAIAEGFNLKDIIKMADSKKDKKAKKKKKKKIRIKKNENATYTEEWYFEKIKLAAMGMAENGRLPDPDRMQSAYIDNDRQRAACRYQALEDSYKIFSKYGIRSGWPRLESCADSVEKAYDLYFYTFYITNDQYFANKINYKYKNVDIQIAEKNVINAINEFKQCNYAIEQPKKLTAFFLSYFDRYAKFSNEMYKQISEKAKIFYANEEKRIEQERQAQLKKEKERQARIRKEEKERQAKLQEQKEREQQQAVRDKAISKRYMDEIKLQIPILKEKAESKEKMTLVFKGFYIGMPIKDAELLMNYYYGKKIYSIKQDGENKVIKSGKGAKRVLADKDGKVTALNLPSELYNKMFNSEGMDTEQFLRTFIDAYRIPELSVSREELKAVNGQTYGVQDYYFFRSTDKGYEFRHYGPITWFDQDAAYAAAVGLIASPIFGEGDIFVAKIHKVDKRKLTFD